MMGEITLLMHFGGSILILIKRMVPLMVIISFVEAKTLKTRIGICVIRTIIYHVQSCLVLWHVECHKNIGIGEAEHSWGGFRMVKYGKRYAVSSDLSEKQSIV